MRRLTLAVLTVAVMLAVLAGSAQAALTPVVVGGNWSSAFDPSVGYGIKSDQSIASTAFAPGQAVRASAVQGRFFALDDDGLILELRPLGASGRPANTVLWSSTAPIGTNTVTVVRREIAAGPVLSAGARYALVARAPTGRYAWNISAGSGFGAFTSTPQEHEWIVDLSPNSGHFQVEGTPLVAITSGPVSDPNVGYVVFEFDADAGASSVTCRIDAGPPVPCTSPYQTPSGFEGTHTWTVTVVVDGVSASDSRQFFVPPAPLVDPCDGAALGTPGADMRTFTAAADRFDGLAGNDSLNGASGNDCLLGSGGEDKLTGASGDDRLDGGDHADVVAGSGGNDLLGGGRGADRLTGDSGNDTIEARDGFGHDTLQCGTGIDTVRADDGDSVAADCENVSF